MSPSQIQKITVNTAVNATRLNGQPASNYATTGENTFTGDQTISGSLNVSGSINGTILSASYALTASYVVSTDPIVKAGEALSSSFSGSPKTSLVAFATPFSSSNYSVNITGIDIRAWSIQSKNGDGFVINSNSKEDLSNSVYWTAIAFKS
jgi:hypothetical protein